MKAAIFAIAFLSVLNTLFAQNKNEPTAREIIDEYVRTIAENEESSSVIDLLEEFARNKININSADYLELAQLPFLDYNSISKIISYREHKGKFNSLDELYDAGLSADVVRKIKPFLKLESKPHFEKPHTTLAMNLRTRALYDEKKSASLNFNSSKTYARYIAKLNDYLNFNAVVEKDALENNFFDYKSANLVWRSQGFLRTALAGSYSVQFGQGLAVWSPYFFSKGSDIKSSVVKSGEIIAPHKSSEENRFFNGAAASVSAGNFGFAAFYSRKKYDAAIHDGAFSSLSESGLHTDATEIANASALEITAYGGIAFYRATNIRASVLYMKNIFSDTFSPHDAKTPYGTQADYLSFESKFALKNFNFACEVSTTKNSTAQFYSAQFVLSRTLSIIGAFRHYSENYYSLWARGFGEYDNTNNEKGFFFGTIIRTHYGRLAAYYDIFSTVAPTERLPFPIDGSDFLIDFISRKFLKTKIQLRAKSEKKQTYSAVDDEDTKQEIAYKTERFRAAAITEISRSLKIKTQADVTLYSKEAETSRGYSLSEAVIYRAENFSFVAFLSFFNTDDYASRVYVYEYDLDGVFRNTALFHRGARYYTLVKWKVFGSLKLSLKFAETFYTNEYFLDEPNKNSFKTFSFQIEYNPRFVK